MIEEAAPPEGFPFTVFLNEIGERRTLGRHQLLKELPPCLDVNLRPGIFAQWYVIDCRTEADCISLSMFFHQHFDGHWVRAGAEKPTQLSPAVRSDTISKNRNQR